MEIVGTEIQAKSGSLGWLRSLPEKSKAKVVQIAMAIKKLALDDPRRVTHSLKVGLGLSLVSSLYFLRPLYHGLGASVMWAVLTVVVVFEFTVGATLSKGLNRAFATFLAGALGVQAHHLASLSRDNIGEPIILGIFVFLLAAASTFARFFPKIKARYDYGILIFILTFSLVSVSGYRVDEILKFAHERLITIVIGGAICMLVSVAVCPVWAGEELHSLVAVNIERLARSLEGFGSEYFKISEDAEGSKESTSCLQGYRSVINSKSIEETLANFARWEPGHGGFRFGHPWKHYLKIGALTRQCASQIEALSAYLTSPSQAAPEFQMLIEESCRNMSSGSGKALAALATSIRTMTDPSPAIPHIENTKITISDLKAKLKAASLANVDLLKILPSISVASILMETVAQVEKIVESVHELSMLAHFKSVDLDKTHDKPMHFDRGIVKPVVVEDGQGICIVAVCEASLVSSESSQNSQAAMSVEV